MWSVIMVCLMMWRVIMAIVRIMECVTYAKYVTYGKYVMSSVV